MHNIYSSSINPYLCPLSRSSNPLTPLAPPSRRRSLHPSQGNEDSLSHSHSFKGKKFDTPFQDKKITTPLIEIKDKTKLTKHKIQYSLNTQKIYISSKPDNKS